MWLATLTGTGLAVANFASLTTTSTRAGSYPSSLPMPRTPGHDRSNSNPTPYPNNPTIHPKSIGSFPARLMITGKSGLPNM